MLGTKVDDYLVMFFHPAMIQFGSMSVPRAQDDEETSESEESEELSSETDDEDLEMGEPDEV